MAPRKLFGSLYLDGNVGRGENPNGVVAQTSNGTNVNGEGSDGENYAFGLTADGRWNKPGPKGGLVDSTVARPIAVLSNRRR